MPSKTPKQAKFMRAVAHGWKPSRMKSPPSRAVAQEFVNADRKYSGGFAENRYGRGGLAAMSQVDSGSERQRPLQQLGWEEGGDVDYQVEPGVYEAPNVEEMGPALDQMFSDMQTERDARNKEVIDYTWDKTKPLEMETQLDERLEAMNGPEQVEYVKPRLLAAMKEMKMIGESPFGKRYSYFDYGKSQKQVNLWRSKWSQALQQQAREAKGPMPTEEELKRIGVDDAGNPIMMEEEGMQRGGRANRRRNGGGGSGALPTVAPPPTPAPSPWGTEAGTTQDMLDRMGYSGPMGYIGVVSGLRQAGWTAAPGGNDGDLRNTMWYPPEQTLTGGDGGGGPGGPGTPPPRIIPTEPASYVGASSDTSDRESGYRDKLKGHQDKISEIFGSARGGHVNYYQEGGAARPDHAEGPNPFEGRDMPASYARWERENHIAPPPPPEPEAGAEEEDGGIAAWLRGLFTPDPETAIGSGEARGTTEEQLKEMEQAYGGRVNYQAGGLAIAAPAGGVPPWITPTGSGPGYMDEPQGYQVGGGVPYRGVPPQRTPMRPGGGRFGRGRGRPGGASPQRGMMSRGAGQPGALAAMQQQAQQQRAGATPGGGNPWQQRYQQSVAQRGGAGDLPPGIDPRAVAANPEGYARQQAEMQRMQSNAGGAPERFEMPGGGIIGGGPDSYNPDGSGGIHGRGTEEYQRRQAETRSGDIMDRIGGGGGRFGEAMRQARNQPTYQDYVNSGGGFMPPTPGGGNPNAGRPGYDPIGDMQYVTGPGTRPSKPRPGPGMMPPGEEGGGIQGGARVPPNQRGFLQRQRMMNRPPSGPVGGGGNRVGMQDQQGALSRAMQRGTGRPPTSRRFGRGRAGSGRGFGMQ